MDDLVLQALKRWPDVPDCTGWLALDARGDWWIRNAEVHPWPRRADGTLDKAGASRVLHDKLLGFIRRNYAAAPDGRWFFQNGPQRVFVELEAAPLVLRLHPGTAPRWTTHLDTDCQPHAGCVDPEGRLFLATSAGPGIVHSLDMSLLAAWLDDALLTLRVPGRAPLALEHLASGEVAARLGFDASPSAAGFSSE
jgi:hypothetical protein